MKNPLSRGKKQAEEPEGDMTLLGHLTELRTRLMRSALAIFIGAVVVYIFNEQIFDFLAQPYYDQQAAEGREQDFLLTAPTEGFSVVLTLSGYGGILLAMPVIIYQMGKFVLPGLYPSERKVLLPFFFASVLLLFGGLVGGYLLMPKTLAVLGGFGPDSFTEIFSPAQYTSFFIKMLLAFGIAAELPLVLIFLQLIGIVSTQTLRKNRRIAIVAVVILSAIVTPTGDPFTLLVLGVPMYFFYEVALIIGGRMTKRRELMVTG